MTDPAGWLAAFGLTAVGSGTPPDARSGAAIRAARTAAGVPVFLKVGAERRELDVYRELAPACAPRLLDSADGPDGIALVLEAAGEARPATAWTPAMWAELGALLAEVHAIPADLPPVGIVPADTSFWTDRLPAVPDVHALLAAVGAPPPGFVHGDCHAANVLWPGPVLCDWASAGTGSPALDLAFPSVRATPAGAVADGIVAAYRRVRPIDPRAVLAAELLYFLHAWPAFAPLNDETAVARVVARTRHLADRWPT